MAYICDRGFKERDCDIFCSLTLFTFFVVRKDDVIYGWDQMRLSLIVFTLEKNAFLYIFLELGSIQWNVQNIFCNFTVIFCVKLQYFEFCRINTWSQTYQILYLLTHNSC